MEQEIIKQSQKLVSEDPLLGANLGGHYKILELLGRGGMGAVYKAQDLLLDRECAIKVIHQSDLTVDETALKRFRQEAKAASLLSHEAIATIRGFDVDAQTGTPFLVMDLVSGASLSELIKSRKVSPSLLITMAIQIADALEHAHARGVIHRDIKPSNIIVSDADSEKPTVKLLDFGIAKIVNQPEGKTLTQTGEILGTPTYMSPEQCSGQPLDARSDIYSLGCVLYECLNGKPPFSGETPIEVVFKHINDAPQTATTTKELLPLNAVIQRCLEKKPSARYLNAAQLKEDLQNVARGKRNKGYVSQRQRKVLLLRTLTVTCAILAVVIFSLKLFFNVADVSYWDKVIAANPNDGVAYFNRGEVHRLNKDYREGLRDFDKASQLMKEPAEAYRKLAKCYSELDEYKNAEEAATQAIKFDPTNHKTYLDRSQARHELRKYEEAIEDCTKSMRLNPTNTWNNNLVALHNRAGSQCELGNYQSALRDCAEALKLAQGEQKYLVYTHRAAANLGLKQYQDVVHDCNEIIAHDPNSPVAYNLRGKAYRELGKLNEALEDFDSQILLATPQKRMYNDRAALLIGFEKFEDAIRDCDACLEQYPDFSYAYLLRARARIGLGKIDDARKDVQTFLSNGQPTDPSEKAFLQEVQGLLKGH